MSIGMIELTTVDGKALVQWDTIKSISAAKKDFDQFPNFNDFPVIVRCLVGNVTEQYRCVESIEKIQEMIRLERLKASKRDEKTVTKDEFKIAKVSIATTVEELIKLGFTHPDIAGMKNLRGIVGFIMETKLGIPREVVEATLNDAEI